MTANSATTNTAFMRAMAFVPKSAMSTHTHETPANSAQRIHSSLQPNANRMALPSPGTRAPLHWPCTWSNDTASRSSALLASPFVTRRGWPSSPSAMLTMRWVMALPDER